MINTLLFLNLVSIYAVKVETSPVIDGFLVDECWSITEGIVSEFITFQPRSGAIMSQPTTIKILYDNSAIYFSCFMYDSDPSRIVHQLMARDEDAPVDKLYIYLDTFNDDSNCFIFTITSDGVQLDGKATIEGCDARWDAVWDSAVAESDSGWSAEIAIPFSVLRYSADQEQLWGINFARTISYSNEAGYMCRMKGNGNLDVSLFDDLLGLRQLPSSHGVEIRPFVTGRLQLSHGSEIFDSSWGSAGADLKIPLSMQAVMDLTLFPDFGQIESDADQADISHWDPWLSERRPFFIESADIFSMPFGMFYSRKIGSVAWNGELIPILGGVKVTGTTGKLRYGALEVVTGRVWDNDSTIAEPTTSYSIGSLLEELSPGNWIKLSITSVDVLSQGDIVSEFARSASLSGMLTMAEHIQFQGKLGLTWNKDQEDSDYSAMRLDAGYFLDRFDVNFGVERKGKDFSPEHMGYVQENGETSYSVNSSMTHDFNTGFINKASFGITPIYTHDSRNRNSGSGVNLWARGLTCNGYSIDCWGDYTDRWFDRYEGPNGRWYQGGFSGGVSSSTDYRKPLACLVRANREQFLDSWSQRFAMSFRIKPTSVLLIDFEPSLQTQHSATRYNWDEEVWEKTSSYWKSLSISASLMITAQMRLRLNGQSSHFERVWETESSSSTNDKLWANLLFSWEYNPGSWLHFMIGEVSEVEENPQFAIYAKLTHYI